MAAQAFLDGVEITNVALDGSATRRLNRPATATVRLPIDHAIGDVGSRLRVDFDGSIFFHGMVMQLEDESDEDFGYTTYNATDPMELWQFRPCRNFTGPDPGNLITPDFLERLQSGPQVLEEILKASENPALIPEAAEGPLFITYGSFQTGGTPMSGAPTNWPMSIMDMVSLMTSTGEFDVVLTPIDSGINMAQVSGYNGRFGDNLTGSVVFDFALGNHNVRSIRRSVDMSTVANKIQYFFGPKETLTRYKANITGDDPCLSGNLYGTPGGVGGSLPGRPNYNAPDKDLGLRRQASQGLYGVRFDFQEWDIDVVTRENPDGPDSDGPYFPCGDFARELFRRRWQEESWIRAQPRTLVHITPVRTSDNMQLPPGVTPVNVGDFDIGDQVSVNAGPSFRGGFSGMGQRVYGYTVNWDSEGVYQIGEIQTSSDAEG